MESLNVFRNSYQLNLLIKCIKLWSVLIWIQINLGVTLNSLMEKVERTQYQAARAITGTWQGTGRSKCYEELGRETLSDRRWCRRFLHRPLYTLNNSNTFQ